MSHHQDQHQGAEICLVFESCSIGPGSITRGWILSAREIHSFSSGPKCPGVAEVPGSPSCHIKWAEIKESQPHTRAASPHSSAPAPLLFFPFSSPIYIFHSFTRDVNLSLISNSLVCVWGMNSICFCSTLSDTAAIRLNDNCGPNNKNTI